MAVIPCVGKLNNNLVTESYEGYSDGGDYVAGDLCGTTYVELSWIIWR